MTTDRQKLNRFVKDATILLVSLILTEPLMTTSQIGRISLLQKRGRRLMGEKVPYGQRKSLARRKAGEGEKPNG